MRQLQSKYSTKLFRSTQVVGMVVGIGGMVFLGAVCTKTAVKTNDINAGINSSISNSNENANTTEIDTSDWLTYTNQEYGLIFKYPTNWNIKQEWLESGVKGKKYNIFLQNQEKESILFFLTTSDFVAEEGEGDKLYVSGEPLINRIDDLKKRGLPIYANYNKQTSLINTYYITPTYEGTKLSLLTLVENQKKEFPFLSINSPVIADWSVVVESSQLNLAIENFETQTLKNKKGNDEYLQIIKTIQY